MMGGRGATSEQGTANQIKEVRRLVRKCFLRLEYCIQYAWGGNVALTLDHFPQISVLDNGVISLSGYNGRGVALATVLGKVVADFLNGTPVRNWFSDHFQKPIPFFNITSMRYQSYLGIKRF